MKTTTSQRLWLALWGFSLLAAGGAVPARASCTLEGTVREIVGMSLREPSIRIFSGRVVRIETSKRRPDDIFPFYRVTFDVHRSWKGKLARTTLVQAGGDGDTFHFHQGGSYLVYARGHLASEPAVLKVDMCDATKSMDRASADLQILGPGTAPTGDAPPETKRRNIFLTVIAVAATLALGAFALIQQRPRAPQN